MPQDANDFLSECCKLIDIRMVDPFTNNTNTKCTLNLLGYSVKSMLEEIKDLDSTNLIKGPTPDKDSKYGGEVWIFKKSIQGHTIYIKLKVREADGKLFIMSFHLDRP